MEKVSVVINTFNEEENLPRCLSSVRGFADEIIVVDMHSTDRTVKIAENYKAKVFFHEYTSYVEPARNFAIQKAQGKYILIIDADEELTLALAKRLKEVTQENKYDYVSIPRKNIIFGKWIKHSCWWPDYNVRFFKKGKVSWDKKIHSIPQTMGEGIDLEAEEENALVHYNYQSISQFIERLNRYTDIQSIDLLKSGYKFDWKDLVTKPSNEFLSRYYLGDGFKDGLHGLVLALLQAFSELAVYLKVWERQGFGQHEIKDIDLLITEQSNNLLHWRIINTPSLLSKIALKIKKRF